MPQKNPINWNESKDRAKRVERWATGQRTKERSREFSQEFDPEPEAGDFLILARDHLALLREKEGKK